MTRLTIITIACLLVLSACAKAPKVEKETPLAAEEIPQEALTEEKPKVEETSEEILQEMEEPPTAEEILQKASEALAKISDAKLTAEHFDADGGLTRKELIEYKKPEMYRSEATNMTFGGNSLSISDGKTVWRYQPDDQVVRVSALE